MHFMDRLIRHTPFLWFLFLGLVITQSSLFFPQTLGSKKIVAGWPLTMFVQEYKRITDISSSGSIVHRIVPAQNQLIVEKAFLNVVLWTVILFITWITYRTVELRFLEKNKAKKKK